MERTLHSSLNSSVGFLEDKLAGVPNGSTLVEGPRCVRLVHGQMVKLKQYSVPLGLKLHSAWGPVEVHPQVFPVLIGDVPVLGRVALWTPTISPNAEPDRIVRAANLNVQKVHTSGLGPSDQSYSPDRMI